MRFDKARGDLEIALYPFPIQQYAHAVRRIANVNKGSTVARIMANNPATLGEFAAEHTLNLSRAVTPMSPRSD